MIVGPGTEVGGYRVEQTIGAGSTAYVHRAERVSDGESVVLKVLREELVDDASMRRRFLRESRYAAALDHPHVVRILDSGQHGDVLYIAMQHIVGTDLYAVLEEGPLEPEASILILAQVADALDAAHAIGLLHRDVKPGNVLVERSGDAPPRCFVTDFGLSQRITHDSMALTAPGSFVGSLAYTAPEQMLGDDPGAAVDVYALGCVLFECLAGEPPFTGEALEVMQSHLESPAPKLTERSPSFPRALDAVITRALAKDPGERYATCTDLLRAAAGALRVAFPTILPARADAPDLRKASSEQAPREPTALVVTGGDAAGTAIDIVGELLIGRAEPGPGRLAGDPELSRRHAVVRSVAGEGLTIEDLGSRNGTYVNDLRIEGREIVNLGDAITVGASTLVAVAQTAATGPPAAVREPDRATSLTAPRLSLRVTFAPEAGTATLQLDEASEPIALSYRGGRWRLSDTRAGG